MRLVAIVCLLVLLTACARYPTEQAQAVDDRPRLAFDASALQQQPEQYELYIDGVSYGSLAQYLVDENALRVVDGRHQLQVRRAGQSIFEREVVLGPNSTRVVKVHEYRQQ